MDYVFGPVASRRMGLSLGLDIIPKFTCSYNCVYCEVGYMVNQTLKRADYVPVADVLTEVQASIERFPHLDYITFSGSGEPTLHSSIGQIISGIKRMTDIPIAIITNGSLLYQPRVRRDLMRVDLMMPSLDAVTQEVFERINGSRMKVSRVIEGIRQFRAEFPGEIWLEILFVRGINDTESEVRNLANVVRTLSMDRIQLNTVVRPPAAPHTKPLTYEELDRIRQIIGHPAEIIAHFDKDVEKTEEPSDPQVELLELLDRRGCTFDEISDGLRVAPDVLEPLLQRFLHQEIIEQTQHHGMIYYRRTAK